MFQHHVPFFVDPYTQAKLDLHTFKAELDNVVEGVFVNPETLILYPIVNEVPIFIKNKVPVSFFEKYKNQLLGIVGDEKKVKFQVEKGGKEFSFSKEWEAAHKDQVETIWGIPLKERLEIHFADTETTEQEQNGKRILDVGCGNGILCKALGEKGATVFGVDYSTSVWNAQEKMKHANVCFLQADLHFLPVPDFSMDIVYSNGVLHHTSSTENAFKQVAPKVKKGGKFYIWLYKRGETFGFNTYLYTTDAMRFVVNKLPHSMQRAIVESLVWLKVKYNGAISRPEDPAVIRTNMYDTFTPEYKFYHTLEEASTWYVKYGFSNPRQTHKNIFGIGILGDR